MNLTQNKEIFELTREDLFVNGNRDIMDILAERSLKKQEKVHHVKP